jgi:hypothetical protein
VLKCRSAGINDQIEPKVPFSYQTKGPTAQAEQQTEQTNK